MAKLIDLLQVGGGKKLRADADSLRVDTDALRKDLDDEILRANNADKFHDNRLGTITTAFTGLQEEINSIKQIERRLDFLSLDESKPTELVLPFAPNTTLVVLYINGVPYHEDAEFTVNRETRVITWIFTFSNGGFDLDADDVIRTEYFV
jgi:hypothetical protein